MTLALAEAAKNTNNAMAKMNKKIILNSLPPSDIYNPTAALPILKSFLKKNGYNTEVKYWQLLMDPAISRLPSEDTTDISLIKLLPFYSFISENINDNESKQRILSLLYRIEPQNINEINYFDELLSDVKKEILSVIDKELEKIDFENVLLFGITSKFYQWIPATILAKRVKQKYPATKIVIGGFGSKNEAVEILNICNYFDFAIWGEGEYPLLELCEQLSKQIKSYELIPRLAYRENDSVNVSTENKSNYLDFDNYIFPDYDEYFKNFPEKENISYIRLPVNSIRSCLWKKCKFCNYNQGYKYRERKPESIIEEIEYMSGKYNIYKFNFVDNDIVGTSIERFDKLLDLLITSSQKAAESYDLWTQLIPHTSLNARFIKKMAIAKFSTAFIGYEAITDKLLQKMNKSNGFANNIFFVKWGLKFNVGSTVNIIRGVPDETVEDVLESTFNLHFLRFYLSVPDSKFIHNQGDFGLYKEAPYCKNLTNKEIEEYSINIFSQYLPKYYLKEKLIFFSGVKKIFDNWKEWQNFLISELYYKNNRHSYKIMKHGSVVYYEEYCNNQLIQTISFDQPEYIDVLKETNEKVISFTELFKKISAKHSAITAEKLMDILKKLKSEYLLYYNYDLTSVISIIDIGDIYDN